MTGASCQPDQPRVSHSRIGPSLTAAFSRLAPAARLPLLLQYLGSSASLIVGNAAQLVTFAILARSLGVEQFGQLITVTALTALAVQLCGLGASETMVRRVAAEPALYPRALGHNLILIAVTGVGLVAAFAIALPFVFTIAADPFRNALSLFLIVATNVVLVRLIMLAEAIFLARWRFSQANLVIVGFALIRTAAAAAACLLFGVETVEAWAFWHAGAHLVMALVCLLALRHLGRPRWGLMREELRLGFYFCTPFFFEAVRQNADLLVLGAVTDAKVVGAYAMARRISVASILAVDGMQRLVYPRFAAAMKDGIHAAFPLALRVLGLGLVISLVTAAGVWIAAPLMPLVFGPDFSQMVGYLQAMSGLVVLVVLYDVPAAFLGAAAKQGLRAAIFNTVGLAGAGLLALLTYAFLVPGTIATLYVIEIVLALAFWLALSNVLRRTPPGAAPTPLEGAP